MSAADPLSVALSASMPIPANAWPDSTRAQCIRLAEQLCGSAGLSAFLRSIQPDYGITGAELLETQPDALLAALQERKRQMDAEFEIAELVAELREIQPMREI